MLFDRNTATVVADGYNVVWQQAQDDAVSVAGHGFIDAVVDDFPDEMMEASYDRLRSMGWPEDDLLREKYRFHMGGYTCSD